jgi:hypothetical protein
VSLEAVHRWGQRFRKNEETLPDLLTSFWNLYEGILGKWASGHDPYVLHQSACNEAALKAATSISRSKFSYRGHFDRYVIHNLTLPCNDVLSLWGQRWHSILLSLMSTIMCS